MDHIFMNHSVHSVASWKRAFPNAREIPRGEFAQIKSRAGLICWLRIAYNDNALAQQLTREVRKHLSDAKVVVLSDVPSDEQAVILLALGVDGYCNSHAAESVLTQVADVVARNGLWVGQGIMHRLVEAIGKAKHEASHNAGLSDLEKTLSARELSVAKLVACGASNKEISKELKISERTVKAHLSSVFEKTGVRDRLQLSLRVNGVLEK